MSISGRFFIFLVFMFMGSILSAQQPHCYTDEYLETIEQNSPASYQRIVELRERVLEMLPNARITNETYTIPVVVHVVYNSEEENIDDEQIFEQIFILNEDFQRLNADTINTPDTFVPVAANCNIQFCLASIDPNGDTTTGITRTYTDKDSFPLAIAEKVKSTAEGGEDAWPSNSYLNIWVCDLQEGVLGYSSMPGGPAESDGLVIGYRFVGLGDISSAPYNLGRTATHEVGHWLGLFHIWGDDVNSCSQDDGIDDTPLQQDKTYGCPDFPLLDECSPEFPGVMFMNYLDYTDDACMNIFTKGQSDVMRLTLETIRGSILNSPAGCNEIEPLPGNIAEILVYPNPTDGQFTVAINNFKGTAGVMQVRVYDLLGQLIEEQFPEPANYVSAYFNLSKLSKGCYFIEAFNGTYFLSKQIMIF